MNKKVLNIVRKTCTTVWEQFGDAISEETENKLHKIVEITNS